MLQNAAVGKEDVRSHWRSVNAELLIVGNINKLVYSTSRITALSSTKLHYIFRAVDKTWNM